MLKALLKKFKVTDLNSVKKINRNEIVNAMNAIESKIDLLKAPYLVRDDFKMYRELLDYIPSYDIFFIEDKFLPFLEENNPNTLRIIELTILFYMLNIYDILTQTEYDIIKVNEDVGAVIKDLEMSVFDFAWEVYKNILFADRNTRNLFIFDYSFYLTDELNRLVEKTFFENYYGSLFERCINHMVGAYCIRFSATTYLAEYQNIFFKVADNYKKKIDRNFT